MPSFGDCILGMSAVPGAMAIRRLPTERMEESIIWKTANA